MQSKLSICCHPLRFPIETPGAADGIIGNGYAAKPRRSSQLRCAPISERKNVYACRCVAYSMTAQMLEGSLFQDKTLVLSKEATLDSQEVKDKSEAVIVQCLDWCRTAGIKSIRGLGIDAFAVSLLGVDAAGNPVTPCFSYADTRTDEFAQALRSKLGEKAQAEAFERTGTVIHGSYAAAHYLRICAQQPELVPRVVVWRTLGAHLIAQLAGGDSSSPVGYSEASWTGLMNRHTLQWDQALCDAIGLSTDRLPPLVDLEDTLSFSSEWIGQYPELAGAQIFMALGDGAAANVGSGATDQSRICVTVGTSAAVRCVIKSATAPKLAAGLWNYRISRNRHLIGGALTDAGSLYQ